MPAYKAQFLKEAIESILNQSYQNLELVVVDDTSPENLESIVSEFKDNRVRYHRNEQNIGGTDLVKQWNHCLTFATGDYVILAADDDVYDKDFLAEAVRLFQKYPDVPLLRAWTQSIDEGGNVLSIDIKCAEYMEIWDFILVSNHISAGIGNYIFKKEKLLKDCFINFPAAWWSDWATTINCADRGVLFTDKILYSFRMSSIRVSSCNTKKSILDKIVATNQYSIWLKEKINSIAKEGSQGTYIKICNKLFFESNHYFFRSIQKEVFSTKLADLLSLLSSAHKNRAISKREQYKLFIFYLRDKIFNLIKTTFQRN